MTPSSPRLHFVYKKPKSFPGKVNHEKQETFKTSLCGAETTTKTQMTESTVVDASHPQHNNMPFYGWIYAGRNKSY